MKIIGFANDHAGFELKEKLKKYLSEKDDFQIKDFGCNSLESCDYPDFAHLLATAVENNECDFGIAICGTGNGINMTVNKHQKIRSALCWAPEITVLARQHNNANICALPARYLDFETTVKIIDLFLSVDFEGGRHLNRINKIPC
ncbi:MAG: ribose 5-phosphate isomerase B [Bacteroidales bacterium]|nr:ribose 5-phosphate isomerase B [Bacteroidales bacterium]